MSTLPPPTMTKEQEKNLVALLEQNARDVLPDPPTRVASNGAVLADLPEGSRQILIVDDFAMFSANWQVSTTNPSVHGQPHIKLMGRASPSSDVSHGYIRFVDGSLRRPSYSASRKRIDIYMPSWALAQVHQQLSHANRYLWVGHFAGGHIYGDLHSTP